MEEILSLYQATKVQTEALEAELVACANVRTLSTTLALIDDTCVLFRILLDLRHFALKSVLEAHLENDIRELTCSHGY